MPKPFYDLSNIRLILQRIGRCSTFLYHGIRCDELTKLKVGSIETRRGVQFLRIHGKRSKIRYVPAHPGTLELIYEYLEAAGHEGELEAPLFQPASNNTKNSFKALNSASVYREIVKKYCKEAGVDVVGFCTHGLRATAA